jgi:ribosomal-protein-alanine N-acetyltransferase
MTVALDGAKVLVRPMLLDDLEQVSAIDRDSFSLPWPERAYHYELTQNPAAQLQVAEAVWPQGGCHVIGMIVVWRIVDEAHVATLAVEKNFRGQGIGRRLLAQALHIAAMSGARSALLEVRAGNTAAQKLYFDFGFKVVGRRPRYYKDNNEDALLMTCQLPQPAELDQAYARWTSR